MHFVYIKNAVSSFRIGMAETEPNKPILIDKSTLNIKTTKMCPAESKPIFSQNTGPLILRRHCALGTSLKKVENNSSPLGKRVFIIF